MIFLRVDLNRDLNHLILNRPTLGQDHQNALPPNLPIRYIYHVYVHVQCYDVGGGHKMPIVIIKLYYQPLSMLDMFLHVHVCVVVHSWPS